MSRHTSATIKRYNSNGAPKRLRTGVLVCLGLLLYAASSTFGATFAVTEEELDALFVQAPDRLIDVAGLPHKTEEGRTYVQVGDSFLMTKNYGGIEAAFGGSLWPNGTVYYVFDAGVSATNRQLFLSAAADWSAAAKLTFVELSSASGNCILVRNDDTSNFSSVIGMGGGTQTIAIHNWQEFIVAHEIGHALGLIHEQCRSDRDSFVTIEWQNIPSDSDTQYQFQIQTASLYGAYDFDSVMHYSQCSFTICTSCTSSCHTIAVKPPNDTQWQDLIGQRSHLSDLDRSGMAQRYGGGGGQELITNGNFEAQYTGWSVNGNADILAGSYPHGGNYYGYLGNTNNAFGNLFTTASVSIPSNAATATLSFWLNITSEETDNVAYDKMNVSILPASGGSNTLKTYSNLDKNSGPGNPNYSQRSFDLKSYRGQSVKIYFDATTDPNLITTFRIDDVSLKVTSPTPSPTPTATATATATVKPTATATATATAPPETISAPSTPSGPTSGTAGVSYSYSASGGSSNLGHSLQYQFDWGDGTTSLWLAVGTNSDSHSWSSGGTYSVRVRARCATHTTIVSGYSSSRSVTITPPETISTPSTPTGSATGSAGLSYSYSTGGASSSLGHTVQYQFDWGDGGYSGWLPPGTIGTSHVWVVPGTYLVRAQARCSTDNAVVSSLSNTFSVKIDYAPPTVAIANGAVIGLVANADGMFVTAENAGASPLIANRPGLGGWEQFQIFDLGDGTIALKSLVNGKLVSAANGGSSPLIANRDTVGAWEQFRLQDAGNGNFVIVAKANGKYVCAEDGGKSSLIANRTSAGGWEQFRMVFRPSVKPFNVTASFQAGGGGYISAGAGGSAALTPSQISEGTSEQFQINDIGNGNVAIRSLANGRFVTAENFGRDPLVANRDAIGTWEQFQLFDAGAGMVALRAVVNGQYVSVNNTGEFLIANRNYVGPLERFFLNISLRAIVNAAFVCADNYGNSPLIANRSWIGGWEQFQVVNTGDGSFGLKAKVNGMYVCAENFGQEPLIANRASPGFWETFKWINVGNGNIELKAAVNGMFVCADNEGKSALIANRPTASVWEQFH